MKKRLLMAACALATSAMAQTSLPDPTRPPPGLQSSDGAQANVEAPAALVLQSVLLGQGRTPAAVISGKLVALGESIGDARLAHIAAQSVQLKGAQGTTTLTLMPEGQKRARTLRAELAK